MKRIAIAAAAALLMLGTAHAQQMRGAVSPWYGEIGYSFLQVEENITGFDANPGALRGIIGYNFHPFFAVEGMLALGTNSDSDRGLDAKLQHAFGIFVKPKYNWNNFEAFARLGWATTNVEFNVPGLGTDKSESDFAYGFGLNYNFNPRMYVGADWMQLMDQNSVKVRGWTLSFGYRF
jgi:opacity protein-like surface antigen